MKYNSLKPSVVKRFKMPLLNGGAAIKKPQTEISDNALFDCKNVWYKDGRLKTRLGLFAKSENAVVLEKDSPFNEFDYHLTDTVVNHYGLEYKIAYSTLLSDDYMYVINVYLVSSDVNIISIGSFTFFRLSSEIFNAPESILFYTGAPQTGGGIFALITLSNQESYGDKYYNIYEINENFTDWQRVYDFYTPTLLVNGRGNNYDRARAEAKLSFKNPQTVESQNLLNSMFYAYYTSDGFSNMFRLPFGALSSDTITCRINYTPSAFVEWKILGTNIADTKSFMGLNITLEVDREKGTLSFFKDNVDYPIPVISTYNENNIKVTAGKNTPNGLEQVVDSKCSLMADGRIYLAGGQNGNVLISARCENPLYFPKSSAVEVGDSGEITALSLQNNKIIAFKQSETHAVTLRKGKIISEISLISDNDKIFKSADILNSQLLLQNVGCIYKGTVCKVGKNTVWLANDRNVYLIDSLGIDSAVKLTDRADVKAFLTPDSFAVSDGQYYILSCFNTALACDLTIPQKPKWYPWQVDKGIMLRGGFCKNSMLYFLCSKGREEIFYVAVLNGDTDTEICFDSNRELISQSKKVESFIVTKSYALSGVTQKSTIESIYLALAGKGKLKIKINDRQTVEVDLRFSTDDYDKGEYKTVMLSPHLYDTESVKIEISSLDAFAVSDIEIFYRKTG